MGDFLKFEKFYWFDSQIRQNRFPNQKQLAERFETNLSTAKRAFNFMRDRMHAPFDYSHKNRGYYYTNESFELPRFKISQEELLTLLLAKNLLTPSAGGVISDQIASFIDKLTCSDGEVRIDARSLNDSFSATWVGHTPSAPDIFHKTFQCLIGKRLLDFTYTSPKEESTSSRTVEPHHLQHYMGNWIMIGFCHLRGEWRKFTVSRMSDAAILDETFDLRPKTEWEKELQGGYGLFQGGPLTEVILRFNKFRTGWVKGEIWHPKQKVEELPDGSLRLSFPVTKYHEVKMRVLQYGADVEVEAPEELKEKIKEEIEKMQKIYI